MILIIKVIISYQEENRERNLYWLVANLEVSINTVIQGKIYS